MTREEIREQVVDYIGGRTDQTVLINREIDNAMRHLSRISVENLQYVWKDLQTRQVGTFTNASNLWNMPADCKVAIAINVYDGVSTANHLIEKSQRWMNERYPRPAQLTKAIPVYYSQFGRVFQVHPWADVDYDFEVFYGQTVTLMTADTDTPCIEDIEDVLIYETSIRTLRSLGLKDRAGSFLLARDQALLAAIQQDASKPGMVHTPGRFDIAGGTQNISNAPFDEYADVSFGGANRGQ